MLLGDMLCVLDVAVPAVTVQVRRVGVPSRRVGGRPHGG